MLGYTSTREAEAESKVSLVYRGSFRTAREVYKGKPHLTLKKKRD